MSYLSIETMLRVLIPPEELDENGDLPASLLELAKRYERACAYLGGRHRSRQVAALLYAVWEQQKHLL